MARLVGILAALAVARASAWSYDRCDGEQGPDSWPSSSSKCRLLAETTAEVVKCGEQSPIDLCGATDTSLMVTTDERLGSRVLWSAHSLSSRGMTAALHRMCLECV